MQTRAGLSLVFAALAVASGALVHCVGDDPTIAAPSDAGGSETSPRDPTTDAPSGTDSGDGASALPLVTDAILVAAGQLHTCAITAGQDVLCWGSNASGQLGVPIAQTPFSSRAVKVDIGGKATAIAAGANHTCAIMTTGTIKCWGKNEHGQLGRASLLTTGEVDVVTAPTDNATLWTKAEVITAGANHTCAAMFEGNLNGLPIRRVFCWGENIARQIGTEKSNGQPVTTPSLITVNGDDVVNPPVEAFTVAAGDDFSCVGYFGAAGAAYFSLAGCWGSRASGQIGAPPQVGFDVKIDYPSELADGGQKPAFGLFAAGLLATGAAHGCVRFDQAGVTPTALECWGNNTSGQTGSSSLGVRPAEHIAGFDASNVTALAAGGQSTCVIDKGQTRCIGANDVGQLGTGAIDAAPHATFADVMVPPVASALAVGTQHACAVLGGAAGAKGQIACWGQNQNGQLGDALDLDVGYPGAPDAQKRIHAVPVRVVAPL